MATIRERIKVFEGKGLNPQKYFYTTIEVANTDTEYHPFNPEVVGAFGIRLYFSLTDIRGVSSVAITRNQIRVNKVAAFDWKDVYPPVRKVIKDYLHQAGFTFDYVEEGWLALAIKRFSTAIRSILG